MHPLPLEDSLSFEPGPEKGVTLSCDLPTLRVDSTNLVHRAASVFFAAARIEGGVRIHLEKRVPLAAGLGGGSSNAAITLLALNELFDQPLASSDLNRLAGALGSDVPFFLQTLPALAAGRGEQITPLGRFRALENVSVFLIHPGFGVSTAWAYQALAQFPQALNGRRGRAQELITLLQSTNLEKAAEGFYNSLEAPVLTKYPILALYQEFLREQGAAATLMSGSGSTTFAVFKNRTGLDGIQGKWQERFGDRCWTAIVPL